MNGDLEISGVYSIARGEEGRFGMIKILAHQPEADTIYARVFERCANVRPEIAWFEDCEHCELDELLKVAIGVLPITERVFRFWQPQLLFSQEVSDAEKDDLMECFDVAQPWDNLAYA